MAAAAPAAAEIGGRLAVASEETFRGRSISAGRPTIGLDLAYDDVGGAYGGVATKAVLLSDATPAFLSVEGYAGYAVRIGPAVSLDLAVTHTEYGYRSGFGRATGYSELSLGLLASRTSARLSLSPDWLGAGNHTLYAEAARTIDLPAGWQLAAHAGAFVWLSANRPAGVPPVRYDTRLGIARSFGRVRIEGAWVFGGPHSDRYRGDDHGHHILTIGASLRL